MTTISVGLQNDGTINVDMALEDDEGKEDWSFNNLELEEAKFLRDELNEAIKRAEAQGLARDKAVDEILHDV